MSIPAIGESAPSFTLPGMVVRGGVRTDDEYDLSAEIGRTVVLAFYPGDATAVCTAQLCSYQAELDEFTDLGATVWGISPQALDSHEGFARGSSLAFPLLSDTAGSAIRAYGVQAPGIGLRRSVFVIGPDGVVRWRHIGLVGLRFPKAETIREQIELLVS
ncbi:MULTISPECIES: peroxiredoxin [unclassified Curtobacterium]|uniref:peroxiredoxin n=1 Tax=unclassified Curtobacterium TaxID=257496 RepID=UPI000D8773D7|nr:MULTISPECIES: peroxiredoxin [unclassified Curtobacterium]PYY55976.1 peroxiredoxin [Curtobacterium sp. MCSS17_011]PYY64193.1 peroxiredoxin [Curtobacterium sp. MCPF17_003]PZE70159.1 peroxiredoxin [Curtobacterium sp. MCPF17_018]WIB71622.1 peroxiredoxin [Curtobacterium sp. MCBD17_026]